MLRRNILIFQTGGLGDFVLTWPFAVGLGRIYPQSRIVYVTHSQKGELARRVLRLEATDTEAGWHGLFTEGGSLPPAAKSLLESAQAVYTFLPASPIWKGNIARINAHAKCVEIDAWLPADYPGHLTDRIIEQLKAHAAEGAATEQILRSVANRGIGFKPAGGRDIVIHPGAGSPGKCWPLDRYLELAASLTKAGKSVRFVVGEVEQDRWSQSDLKQIKQVATVNCCGSLLELLGEISTAAAFIGNDSGPAHLAGIIGVPTVALFGPTQPAQWRPLGPAIQLIQRQPIAQISVAEVLQII